MREKLGAAGEELEAAKRKSAELEARLGPLERECREAQVAREHLRCGGCMFCDGNEGGGRGAELACVVWRWVGMRAPGGCCRGFRLFREAYFFCKFRGG